MRGRPLGADPREKVLAFHQPVANDLPFLAVTPKIDNDHERVKGESSLVDRALLILPASRNLERIADHATNLAQDVVYMVEGEISRYPPAERS
jgi:phosphate uptake regulator